jgi:3-phytase
VVTERLTRSLRFYRVHDSAPHLRPLGAIPVFEGESGERAAPMGIALYRRRSDDALFAIVSRKTGPADGYLWQYRLWVEGDRVRAEKVRAFGAFSGTAEIEAVAVDARAEKVIYSDEDCCLRVYAADPAARDANRELARFGEQGFRGNREGIAVAGRWVIATDQLPNGSEYHVFDRKSLKEVVVWKGTAQSTDGIDAIARPMGSRFRKGFLVAMNEASRNFQLYPLP